MRHVQAQVTSLAVCMLFVVVPRSGCADCIITDSPYKFEVVCSGYNPMSPPDVSRKKPGMVKKTRKTMKMAFEGNSNTALTAIMNEEEIRVMQKRNRQDGYRVKRSPGRQTPKNDAADHDKNS